MNNLTTNNHSHNSHNSHYSSSEDKNLHNVLYVEPTLFGRGQLNPFSNRLRFSDFTINTLFRPNYHTTRSTNFIFDLPDYLTKVASYEMVRFSCNTFFYNISELPGSNVITIIINSPPNNLDDIAITIKINSGSYTASDIQSFFNNYFQASSNGLQFLVCEYNNLSNKFSFRARSFWLDGYLSQLIQDATVPIIDPENPNINKIVQLGGGVYDEFIIDPTDPTKLINNPFYNPDCNFIFDFSVSRVGQETNNYRNLGWVLGFTSCTYILNMNTCNTYYGNPYYNFLVYFSNKYDNTPYINLIGDPPLTNDLYLQKYFDIMTSELTIYGFLPADIMFVNTSSLNSGIYFFLDIDDYNKNYNPTNTYS